MAETMRNFAHEGEGEGREERFPVTIFLFGEREGEAGCGRRC